MAPSPAEIKMPGDFNFESTAESTARHMQIITTRKAYGDMAEIAVKWFRKSPRKIPPSIGIGDQDSKVTSVSDARRHVGNTRRAFAQHRQNLRPFAHVVQSIRP